MGVSPNSSPHLQRVASPRPRVNNEDRCRSSQCHCRKRDPPFTCAHSLQEKLCCHWEHGTMWSPFYPAPLPWQPTSHNDRKAGKGCLEWGWGGGETLLASSGFPTPSSWLVHVPGAPALPASRGQTFHLRFSTCPSLTPSRPHQWESKGTNLFSTRTR